MSPPKGGIAGSRSALQRFFDRHNVSVKKKPARGRAKAILISLAHADAGYESKACLIPPGWYETATSTNMVGLRGRCLRGEQLVSLVPHGHWKTITFVAG